MRSMLVLLAGVVMILSAAAHGLLGWPAMLQALHGAGAPADLAAALSIGWYFGSMAMLVFGVVTVLSALRLRRGDSSGVTTIRVIAAGYVLFGLAAILYRHLNAHFLLFVVTGALAGLPLWGLRRRSTIIAGIVLLSLLAPAFGACPATAAGLSVRQLKARYDDIFAFEIKKIDGRTFYTMLVKTLPPSDPLAGFVNVHDLFLNYLQVNGAKCGDLLTDGVSPEEFQAGCLDRMRSSTAIDAALLPALDRYLRGRSGGLEGYQSGPPASITMDELMRVAVRFFYPDTVLPDGSIQAHVCVGLNGMKDLPEPRRLAVEAFAADVILHDMKSPKHPLQDEFSDALQRVIKLGLSSDPEVRLTRVQGALWGSLAQSRRLRRTLRREYDRSRDWLPFVLVKETPIETPPPSHGAV
jgi:hypothetical protein